MSQDIAGAPHSNGIDSVNQGSWNEETHCQGHGFGGAYNSKPGVTYSRGLQKKAIRLATQIDEIFPLAGWRHAGMVKSYGLLAKGNDVVDERVEGRYL